MSATTYEFLENNLRTTNDSLRNIDILERMFEHKKAQFELLFRLSKIVKITYNSLKLSLEGTTDSGIKLTDEQKRDALWSIRQMVKEVREGLIELGDLVHEVAKFSSKNLVQYIFFNLHIHRPMKKISSTFEDLELVINSLDGEDFGKNVSADELIKMLNV